MIYATYKPKVYILGVDTSNTNEGDGFQKKMLISFIRQQTGWDASVLITPYAVQAKVYWDAKRNEKRRESPRLLLLRKERRK